MKLIAFSIGDPSSATTIEGLPSAVNNLVTDPNILTKIFQTLFTLLIVITAILVLVFTVYQAYRYIISQGDKKDLEISRTAFWNGILGLLIVLIAFFIVNVLGYFFHFNPFKVVIK